MFYFLYPILEPENNVIDLIEYKGDEQIVQAVLYSYNPLRDSDLLKKQPEKFYYFRSHYPLRREYKAYTLLNINDENRTLGKRLGFNLE